MTPSNGAEPMNKSCAACAFILMIFAMGIVIGILNSSFWFGEQHGKHLKRMEMADIVQSETLACISASEDCQRLRRIDQVIWK